MASYAAPQSTKSAGRKNRSATPGATPAPAAEITHDRIEARAYEKFVARGHAHGFDQQDWFDAEDELRAETRDRA